MDPGGRNAIHNCELPVATDAILELALLADALTVQSELLIVEVESGFRLFPAEEAQLPVPLLDLVDQLADDLELVESGVRDDVHDDLAAVEVDGDVVDASDASNLELQLSLTWRSQAELLELEHRGVVGRVVADHHGAEVVAPDVELVHQIVNPLVEVWTDFQTHRWYNIFNLLSIT